MTRTPRSWPPEASTWSDGDGFRRLAELAELGAGTAGLLHEIRQPLMVAKGLLELARLEGRGMAADEVSLAADQLTHLQELLEHQVHPGRSEEPARDLEVLEIARWVVAAVLPRARRLGVQVVAEGAEVRARLRPLALRQILLNLAGNAIDAAADSPLRTVRVEVGRRGRHLVVSVRDTGSGVPEAVVRSLFDPFVTTKSAGRGSGLGLWIARSLAEEAGGAVTLAATGPEGTCLELLLPVSGEAAPGGSASS